MIFGFVNEHDISYDNGYVLDKCSICWDSGY